MSASTELRDLVAQTFHEMGGVGSMADVREQVMSILPPDSREHLLRKGVTATIGSYFRERDVDGLPIAPEVDEHGTHMLLDLTTEEEYRYVIRKYMRRSVANRAAAQRMADRCYRALGVSIDIDAEAVAS